MRLGEAVAIARGAKGWSQEQLSKASGVSRISISQIELGARTPRRGTVYKLARAMKIPGELLFEPGVSEGELLAAVRGRTLQTSRSPQNSSPRVKTLLPTRSLCVLRREDLEGKTLKEAAGLGSKQELPGRSEDPEAFYLIAEGIELTWELRCPEGAELLLEPSIPVQPGDLVVVRAPIGLALRRLTVEDGQRELRSLTPAQTTLVWSPGLDLARVARIAVDPSIWR